MLANRIDNAVSHTPSLKMRASHSPPKNPKFGSLAQQFFSSLETNPIAETLFKDIFGFNLPRIAVTRTAKERFDTTIGEFSNSAITLSGTLALAPIFRYPAQWFSGVPMSQLSGEAAKNITPKVQYARLGASFGFLFPFAMAFWSTPFFRNWLTLKKNKIANFDKLIGLEQQHNQQKTQKAKRETLEKEKAYQMSRFFAVNAIGVGLGLASAAAFGILAKKSAGLKSLSKPMQWLFENFELKGSRANQCAEGAATFIFWSVPAYLGWMHAARGQNEFKEWALKFANSTAWFFCFTPMVIKPLFKNAFNTIAQNAGKGKEVFKSSPSYHEIATRFQGPLKDKLMRMKTIQSGVGLLISVTMLGLTPQLLNIFLTKKRYEQRQALRKQFEEKQALEKTQLAQTAPISIKPSIEPLSVKAASVPVEKTALPVVTSYQQIQNPWTTLPPIPLGNMPMSWAGSPRAQAWMTYPSNQANGF